ncbi:hypothetical protein D3C71_1531730 [compost metagenome]
MAAHGFHDVHRHQAPALRRVQRGAHFAVQRKQVDAVDQVAVIALVGSFKQVGMVVAQINAGDGAHRVLAGHGARQPMRRHADAHAALHDGQQLATAEFE